MDSAKDMLSNIAVVLVGTTHPGNIGATARAMKVMGLSDLRLVSPKLFPAAEATARAAGADDILAAASVFEDLKSALRGAAVIYGTTARERRIDWPTMSPRAAASAIATAGAPAALVFGREKTGLTNDELDLCQSAIQIATTDSYRSLNLAQAVQICAYELRLAALEGDLEIRTQSTKSAADEVATAEEIDHLQAHCLKVMGAVGYVKPARPKLIERRLRRLANQSGLRHSEVQILRGFLTAIESRLALREGDD